MGFARTTHEIHLPSEEPELVAIQGNSLLATNEPYIYAAPVSLGMILGKNPGYCPIEQQCVSYVKSRGLIIQGNAKDIQSNTDIPCVGCGVLLYSGRWGHIAYIEKVYGVSFLVSEQNWEGCGIVSKRVIMMNDPDIRGYVSN